MRFLIFTQYFPPEIGAAQARLGAVVTRIAQAGHEVEVVTGMPNYPLGSTFPAYTGRLMMQERSGGVGVLRVWQWPATGSGAARLLNYGSFALTGIVGLARARRPDVIVIESPPLTVAAVGTLGARLYGAHAALNISDLWPDSIANVRTVRRSFLWLLFRLERWVYRHADSISAQTVGISEVLSKDKKVRSERIVLFPNGVDTKQFHPGVATTGVREAFGVHPSDRVLLYAGTLGLFHGLDVAIDAMRLLRDREPSVHLVIVGGGSDRARIGRLLEQAALPNVRLLPPQSPAQLAETWRAADIGLSTSRDLPIAAIARPVKVLAAMASGKPIVYSGVGEGAELVRGAGAGVIVPPGQPEPLAHAVAALARDPDECQRLGENGRSFVESNLSWDRLVQDWLRQMEQRIRG